MNELFFISLRERVAVGRVRGYGHFSIEISNKIKAEPRVSEGQAMTRPVNNP